MMVSGFGLGLGFLFDFLRGLFLCFFGLFGVFLRCLFLGFFFFFFFFYFAGGRRKDRAAMGKRSMCKMASMNFLLGCQSHF